MCGASDCRSGSASTRLRKWAKPDVLVLDDFEMRELTTQHTDDTYELVTQRTGRSLILTSNRRPDDWYPLLPNPVVAESILDRLINTAHTIHLDGRSYRSTRPTLTRTARR